eukprot:m.214393 g.214393  ORF g.214393 m.214393 type:complete len:688 (+) comp15101_c0_seq3:73-2136(+)
MSKRRVSRDDSQRSTANVGQGAAVAASAPEQEGGTSTSASATNGAPPIKTAKVALPKGASGASEAAAAAQSGIASLGSGILELLPHKPGLQTALNSPITCKVCLDIMKNPSIIPCGHSFCRECLFSHMGSRALTCPVCFAPFSEDSLIPNYALACAAEGYKEVQTPLQLRLADLTYPELTHLIGEINRQKHHFEANDRLADVKVCLAFISHLESSRQAQLKTIQEQIKVLSEDKALLLSRQEAMELSDMPLQATQAPALPAPSASASVAAQGELPRIGSVIIPSATAPSSSLTNTPRGTLAPPTVPFKSSVAQSKSSNSLATTVHKRTSRMRMYSEHLEKAYFDTHKDHLDRPDLALDSFQKKLSMLTKYSRLEHICELAYGALFQSASIVSSIEFDKDERYFAAAGVGKKIKVFDYAAVIDESITKHHTPIIAMECRTKISCLSWNSFFTERLASSDYDGVISVWDTNRGTALRVFEEHEKRAWSVDSSASDPYMLASGSDDVQVKVWKTNEKKSVITIKSKANVCCVKFNPINSNYLAFGSADHHVHYYDLRMPNAPLRMFEGHTKAVSYVRFIDNESLVSASTDSTLKLWNVHTRVQQRTFKGHTNEKNFVGLTNCDDFIACGSEDNGVYVYHRAFEEPVIAHKFHTEDTPHKTFVSSVCWRHEDKMLLAANSQGKVFFMKSVE